MKVLSILLQMQNYVVSILYHTPFLRVYFKIVISMCQDALSSLKGALSDQCVYVAIPLKTNYECVVWKRDCQA